ncbi:c-type cytochrome biogenesis protein CcmI [Sedimentimonas flavescens]|uniref:c-type cytochrome biogenesis protein CcmI n=1 Tax=Sedimentimonas flavescens TaxID=2851012 RepID=UPI0021A2FCA8|nr:c-type cytochrome biogenesis protein CcmI [Sedimentimonas flavescens]MCT2538689.1 c-type cytochrome biogenesis protein CcmI [Sedimentimonas flavescens]
MLFWTLTAALVALVALLFVLALVRRHAADAPASAYDVQVYRDQLRDLDKDMSRGVISREEAERTRVEISRRMLEADRVSQAEQDSREAPKGATMAIILVLGAIMATSFYLYQRLGAAGYPDQPIKERFAIANELYDSRPSQDEAEKQAAAAQADQPQPDAQFLELMERLRKAVAERPDDPEGLALLARNEMSMGNYRAGWETKKRLVEVLGDKARAQDYADLGEYMVVAAGGLVTKEAEENFAKALEMDPAEGLSRYYIGLMMAQNGRGDRAFRIWDALLRNGPAQAPWVPAILANIENLAWIAGETRYELPALGGRGPSAADMQAAAEMSPEDRQQMIRGMVAQLNDRLANEGGPAADWAKLISSLRMLGEDDRAQAIWGEAQSRFADLPEDLEMIRAAAEGEVPPMAEAAEPMRGPALTDEQMQSASDMTPEERQEMIANMVNGLVERLESEGGDASQWARAISSLATLGQTERAAEVYSMARTALAGNEAALSVITGAAQAAGVAN